MRLKYLALTCLLIFTAVASRPPRLGWEDGWCWDNVVIQLLYNMRGVTECLLKNAGECRQKNKVLEKYIDLITAIRNNPDRYFLEEMRAHHAEWCNARGCTMCTWSYADIELDWLLKDYFFCCRDFFEMRLKWAVDEPEMVGWKLFPGACAIDDMTSEKSVAEFIVRLEGNVVILTMSQYLLLPVFQAGGIANEYIDLVPLLSDELKKMYPTCLYELIGVGLQGTHVTAYIKDQWEDNPSWYYCDDMAARNLASHKKLDKWPESGPWPGKYLSLLVYKRVDSVGQNKPQVTGDDKDLEKLVRALSLLRSL